MARPKSTAPPTIPGLEARRAALGIPAATIARLAQVQYLRIWTALTSGGANLDADEAERVEAVLARLEAEAAQEAAR